MGDGLQRVKENSVDDLHISERLQKLLPPLADEELAQLRENIEKDGRVREAILFWYDGTQNVIVDGMHRWEIVNGTDIPYETEAAHFADYKAAEIWILNHQLGRRNLLKPAEIRKVRGELYNRLKRADKGHGLQGTPSRGAECQNEPPPPSQVEAAEEVAAKAGVSKSTVKRDGARVEALGRLTKAAQQVAARATDAEVKALAKLDQAAQDQVARAVRTGQAKTVKEALKLTGAKAPAPKPVVAKTGRESDIWQAQQTLKTWIDALGRWMNGNPAGIDTYREKFPGPLGDKAINAAKALLNALEAWKRGIK
jgi:hypothetical protein